MHLLPSTALADERNSDNRAHAARRRLVRLAGRAKREAAAPAARRTAPAPVRPGEATG
jgi:hypothetical protein